MNMPCNSNISVSIKGYLEKIIEADEKIWVNINNLYTELQAKEIIPISLRLMEQKQHDQTVFDVSELAAKESKLIISGGSGSGKTITLKWLNVIYANRCLKDEDSKIPVYIPLNLYNKGTFHDYAMKNAKINGLSESAFDSLLNDNKIIFLIDGLDLLSSRGEFNPYSEIWDFITDHNDCRYVVSSRPGFFSQFERFKVSELEGLNEEKIGSFIEKYAQDNEICEPLKNKILGDEKLKSLFSNPLMLYLAIKVASRQKKDELLPSKRSQMYMDFINGMFEHDSSKMPQGYRLHSNKQQILETLTDLYFFMQCKNEVSMDYCDALEIASKHSGDLRYKPVSAELILEDIFTVGLIPKTDSVITYGIHQSFQEYFSALKLKEYFEKGFDVSEAFRHPKWEEVVLFASEMFDCPDEFVRAMINVSELHLASKCAGNAGQEVKEEICFLLADGLDSRFVQEKVNSVESIARLGDAGISLLSAALHYENNEMRMRAAGALCKTYSNRVVEPLIIALLDENSNVLEVAADALRDIKSNKAVELLISGLRDKNFDFQRIAIYALIQRRSLKKVELLMNALFDEDPVFRESSVDSLGNVKSEFAVDMFIKMLSDENIYARRIAADVLRSIKSEKAVDALIAALCDKDDDVRSNVAYALKKICTSSHKDVLKKLKDSDNEYQANTCFEILNKIDLNERSRAELFQHDPVLRTKSPTPPISTAQQPETGAQDPYFHIAVNKISEIRKPTVIVDYGCGYGKLLTPMKNLGADVLDNIHYIGVDAKTSCLLKSSWTAEKYGLFKNEPEFMTPEVFFKKDISVDFALLMHTLHEIRLVDLVDAIYHIAAKLSAGGQIFILEPGSFIEERNYVLWKDTDFKMIFSDHGFDVRLYPITTNKGHKLNAVNIIKIQNKEFSKETIVQQCFLMFEAKKKELSGMLNKEPAGSGKDKEIDLLYSYVSRQIDEYKAILNTMQ